MRLCRRVAAALPVALALGAAAFAGRDEPVTSTSSDIAQLWVEPADIASRDLVLGPGGQRWVPRPNATYAMLERDTTGYSWGWDVKDAEGVRWAVKYGPEAHSEIAASRIAWAVGYHQPPLHYVEHWTMTGTTPPDRDGPQTPARFRPLPPGWKKVGTWAWQDNPFVGTQPYRGLIVLMKVLNNWDLLTRNNAVYDLPEPIEGSQRWFMVRDLGAALGKPKLFPNSGTRSRIQDFESDPFIKGVEDGEVEFANRGRWHRKLYEGLTPADVRWTCSLLARLTPRQWQDAFRAAHYPPEVAERFVRQLQQRVAYGLSLEDGATRAAER